MGRLTHFERHALHECSQRIFNNDCIHLARGRSTMVSWGTKGVTICALLSRIIKSNMLATLGFQRVRPDRDTRYRVIGTYYSYANVSFHVRECGSRLRGLDLLSSVIVSKLCHRQTCVVYATSAILCTFGQALGAAPY